MHRTVLAIALLLSIPALAQPRYELLPDTNSADHTRRPQADPNFGSAVMPRLAPSVVYQPTPAPAPAPPVKQALWTYHGLYSYLMCDTLPAPYNVCPSAASASCTGADCPVSWCMFACGYDMARREGCGEPGEQSNLSPSERGMQGRIPYGSCND